MQFTDEQRLIVMMLADIQKHLDVRGEFNPEFISKVTAWKEEFAIAWQHNVLFSADDTPESFRFVISVLDMWSFIERAYESLSADEKSQLEKRVKYYGKNPKFAGFDGNNETDLMSHCRLIVEDLSLFSEFKGRDFNSHVPMEGRYRQMLGVFEPIRRVLERRNLNVDELEAVLSV